MIHGKTAQMKRRRRWRVALALVACVLAGALWFAWDSANMQAEAQSALSVRNAVMEI